MKNLYQDNRNLVSITSGPVNVSPGGLSQMLWQMAVSGPVRAAWGAYCKDFEQFGGL